MGGWLEKLRIRLSQLSTKLKMKLKLSLSLETTFLVGLGGWWGGWAAGENAMQLLLGIMLVSYEVDVICQ